MVGPRSRAWRRSRHDGSVAGLPATRAPFGRAVNRSRLRRSRMLSDFLSVGGRDVRFFE